MPLFSRGGPADFVPPGKPGTAASTASLATPKPVPFSAEVAPRRGTRGGEDCRGFGRMYSSID